MGRRLNYEYNAKVTGVYDGDTITVDIDLGFGIWRTGEKVRLYGIDTPELRGDSRDAGLESRDALRSKIFGNRIRIRTIRDKKGKYGRYLGVVYLGSENVNEWLVINDLAVYRDY